MHRSNDSPAAILIPCEPAMLSRRKSSEDTPPPPSGFFLAKSLAIPAIYVKFKFNAHKFKLKFRINGWNYQCYDRGSPENFRRHNIAG